MGIRLSSTFFAKPSYVQKKWLLINAEDQVLGRLASQIAKILRGKHKAYYTPHINCGDNVVVINASKLKLTGKKLQQKVYYRHTGFPGGIKKITAIDLISGKYPERMLQMAVKRMLPKESPLAREQLKSIYIYGGDIHPHSAQLPLLINPVRK
jgi:large subunit ribosomal protein L13